MANIDTGHFKDKLIAEKKKLEEELSALGRKVPGRPNDWMATAPDMNDYSSADKNSAADRMEDFEEKIATENELEQRLTDVNDALGKIEKGTYGICEESGEPIDPARLEANPAARTALKH